MHEDDVQPALGRRTRLSRPFRRDDGLWSCDGRSCWSGDRGWFFKKGSIYLKLEDAKLAFELEIFDNRVYDPVPVHRYFLSGALEYP